MRTTLTLDDDVAALITRIRKKSNISHKALVNKALRHGLKEIAAPPRPARSFRTKSVSLGRCLVGSIDDIAEVLAIAEDEGFK